MSGKLDLDKVERSIGDLDMDVRPVLAELRDLREEKDAFEERLEALRQSQWIQLEDVLAANEKLREENARLSEELKFYKPFAPKWVMKMREPKPPEVKP